MTLPRRLSRSSAPALLAISYLVASLGGCTSSSATVAGHGVPTRLRNFRIDVPTRLPAGVTTFELTGMGPTMHELNVVRTSRAADALPVTAGGLVDDSQSHSDFDHIAEAEGTDIHDRKQLVVDLKPGSYVLYCNMDGHYQAGMTRRLTVVPR